MNNNFSGYHHSRLPNNLEPLNNNNNNNNHLASNQPPQMAVPLQQTPSESSCTESSTDSSTEEDWESGKSIFLATTSHRLPSCSATSKFGLSSANHQSVHHIHPNHHPRRRRKSKSQKKGEREKGDALKNIQSQPVLKAALIRQMSGVWGRERASSRARQNSENTYLEPDKSKYQKGTQNLPEKCSNFLSLSLSNSQISNQNNGNMNFAGSFFNNMENENSLEDLSQSETKDKVSQEKNEAFCSILDDPNSLSNDILEYFDLPISSENSRIPQNVNQQENNSGISNEIFSLNPPSLKDPFSGDLLKVSQNPDNLSNNVSGDKSFLHRFSTYFKRSHSNRNSSPDLSSQVSPPDGVKANRSNSSLKEFFEHCMSPIAPRVKRCNPFTFRHVRQEVDEIVKSREEKE